MLKLWLVIPIIWLGLRINEEHCKSETIIIKKNNKKLISMNNKISFNIGYLFLKKLYNQLKLNNICYEIQDKYKFKFDLNEILSYLVYARIIYPSSKLETFRQCQNFIEQPKFKRHDEYRALNYIAENMDFIQEQLFNNSKDIIKRNSNIIYYDCTNYFFEIDNEDDIRKYGISKEHRPNPIVGMGLFMDGDGYIPEYIRTDITDELHELFNFRTDYEINTYKDFKKIFDTIN